VNVCLFEEVSHTGERELLVVSRISEQMLSFEVQSLKLQLNYGAKMTETILGSWKCKVGTYFLDQIQRSVVTYRPVLRIYGKRVVDNILERIG